MKVDLVHGSPFLVLGTARKPGTPQPDRRLRHTLGVPPAITVPAEWGTA